jgi:23S rRNA (uracil1939-C5)-methyltransferase
VSAEAGGGIDLDIRDLTTRGEGVGKLPDGRAVFVPGAVPGDRVRVRVTQEKARFVLADLAEVLRSSDLRREPRCPLFGECGGCQLQHLRYRAQVEWKASRIGEALRRIGGLQVDDPEVEPSPLEWGYRNRMSFTLKRLGRGRVVAGLHRAGAPGRIVPVSDQCLLPEAPVLRVWVALQASWDSDARLLPPGRELRLTLRRAGEGAALVVEGGRAGGDAWALVERVPGLVSVAHRPATGSLRHLAGAEETLDRWFGEEVPVASGTFMQVNREAGEALHLAVLKEVGNPAGLRIVDGYCGLGAYGRRLARHGATVMGIEVDPVAVAAARHEAPSGLDVREGRVEDLLHEGLPADRLILNPPRGGLHESIPEVLREHRAERILYISCDPATLARDLGRLGSAYRVRSVRGFDLFPQTTHVETLVVLDHASQGERT